MYNFDVVRHFGIRGKGFSSPDNYIIKTLKAFHLLAATAWAGGALSMQALSFLKFNTQDPELIPIIQHCLHFVDTWVVMPGLAGCILTGLFYSLVTAIGFFKFAWIGFKWLISLAACFWGLLFWSSLGDQLIVWLSQWNFDGPLRFIRAFILPESMWQGALQLLIILTMCLISVYRPLSFRGRQRKPVRRVLEKEAEEKLVREKQLAKNKAQTWFPPLEEKDPAAAAAPKEGEVWFSPASRVEGEGSRPVKTGSELWFTPSYIESALKRVNPPDDHELNDILAKSLELTSLSIPEIVALMRVKRPDQLDSLLATAYMVKQKVYGDRVVLSAPLHIANYCGSDCLYCAYRKSNTAIERRYMNLKEMRESGLKLARQGHKRIFLVTGQLPNADIEYLVGAIRVLYSIFEGKDEIRRVNVNVGPLDADDYAVLQQADVGTVLLYQDTYHEASYHTAHPSGPKSDYHKRLDAPETALQSGIYDTGLGLVLGLGPWQFDLLALSQHADYLFRTYGTGGRTVSMHRLRPAPGCHFQTPYPVDDAEYLRCVAITRLAIPYTGIILTSKEPAKLWRDGCTVGASQILTGSVANPYASWSDGPDKVPFPLGEDCQVEEIVRFLLEDARQLPSFCTACPRIGRQGSLFTSMVRDGEMKNQCGPNSMSTFLEYLLHYASAETKRLGLRLIDDKLAAMPELTRRRAKILLEGIRRGKNDEFV